MLVPVFGVVSFTALTGNTMSAVMSNSDTCGKQPGRWCIMAVSSSKDKHAEHGDRTINVNKHAVLAVPGQKLHISRLSVHQVG